VIQPDHCRTCLRTALTLTLAAFAAAALADNLITMPDVKPLGELWVNPGMYSHHFDRDKGLNNDNHGVGAEYRFSSVMTAAAGRFHNSDRDYSNYAGLYYQPLAIGPIRIGAAVVAIDGYPRMHDGNWFLAALPIVGFEYQRVGLNLTIIPSYKDRLYGAITVQFKVKIFD
jgi:hypothetical protein